ncbi:DUF6434 domain-containing protein [Oceaniglobus ichthyenteri]|uniref:DUF6434 domain-containing protein n=1 Tax=Oceaniglobus ichthyenteri TaxID=2136177 RepID=UPI000D3D5916|nr:DUF6434 domain-containing protein [Oceaniglobus ichthyenteri]
MTIDWQTSPLAADTPVDHSFRKTQNVRQFMNTLCGPDFRFDQDMIRFVDEEAPETLGEIAAYWKARGGKRTVKD